MSTPLHDPPRRGSGLRRGPALVLVLVGIFAVVALALALGGQRAATHEDQVRSVATTLRCPVCAGEDVADSAAPLAESMRLVIGEQLEQGRSPAQVREWFAQTYGDDVLLAPPARGAGWVMWAVPLAVLASAGVLLARRWLPEHRRGAGWRSALAGAAVAAVVLAVWLVPATTDGGDPDGTGGAGTAGGNGIPGPGPDRLAGDDAPLGVLRAGVAELPGSAPLRTTLAGRLEADGAYPEAAEEYAALVRLRPLDPDLRYREAFALVRAGDDTGARATLEEALRVEPDHPASLLLLGSLVQQEDTAEGARLLGRFVEVAPEHAQAEEVRGWLERHGTG